MGLFDLLFSQSFEDIEKKADRFFGSAEFGLAKLEYEKALSRIEKKTLPAFSREKERLEKKIDESREALANQHKTNAENLIEAGCIEDAAELLHLSLELTADRELETQVKALLKDLFKPVSLLPHGEGQMLDTDEISFPEPDEEYFTALLNTLDEEDREAYLAYGDEFAQGFMLLNQGDFVNAEDLLSRALEEQGRDVTYIHLELATACLNTGDTGKAERLLVAFVDQYPESIRAYELLCDIFWGNRSYDKAFELLRSCPEALKTSIPINLLVGETLFQAKKYAEAASFYLEFIKINGENTEVSRSLGRSYEALGEKEQALETYADLMAQCKGCGAAVDPIVKQRYADLSFETGNFSDNILEIYLSLCQEDPVNQAGYYRRVSEIYARKGYFDESERYLRFAEAAVNDNP